MKKTNLTLENIIKWAEDVGFTVDSILDKENNNLYHLTLENNNSYGENIIYESDFDNNKPELFLENLKDYIENYNPSEEASIWIDKTGYGNNNAPKEVEDLLNSSKETKNIFGKLYDQISSGGKYNYDYYHDLDLTSLLNINFQEYEPVKMFITDMKRELDSNKPYNQNAEEIFKNVYGAWANGVHSPKDYPDLHSFITVKNAISTIEHWFTKISHYNNFNEEKIFENIGKAIVPAKNLDKSKGQIVTTSPFMTEEQYNIHKMFDECFNQSSTDPINYTNEILIPSVRGIMDTALLNESQHKLWLDTAVHKCTNAGGELWYSNRKIIEKLQKHNLLNKKLSDKKLSKLIETGSLNEHWEFSFKTYLKDTVLTPEKMKEIKQDCKYRLEKIEKNLGKSLYPSPER